VHDAETIGKVVKAVRGPLNILAGPKTPAIAELERLGVARVSFGSWPHRAAKGVFLRFVTGLRDHGTFHVLNDGAIPYPDLNKLVE
jgi:2-methylisocitrate lyase-like PEP mutase family enzyme